MTRIWRVRFLTISIAVLAIAMPFELLLAQQSQTLITSTVVQTTKQDANDFGVNWHREIDLDSAGAVLEGRVYDAQGTLREKETEEFSTANGAKQKTEKLLWDFNDKGKLILGADYKFDLHGGLASLDLTHFGFHGERTWEQITDYETGGYKTEEWKGWNHSWTSEFTPYKPETPKPGVAPQGQIPGVPTSTNVGVLFPRDFHPGDTITGSLATGSYAEMFKAVPGLSEYSFPIQLYHLADGSPEWSSLEIGVKGDGYIPVNPNGLFSLHIPMDWKGPLELQAFQPDSLAGIGPSHATLEMGDPVAAPSLPQNMFSKVAKGKLQYWMTEDLIDLWNEAFDLENKIDDYYEGYGSSDEVDIGGLEEDLEDVYDDIDHLTAHLPKDMVVNLARGMAQETREINEELRKGNLTAGQEAELREYDNWASFLEDEAHEANQLRFWTSLRQIEPFWTSPVLTQNKLGAMRGSFSGDYGDTLFKIDNFPILPLASTPDTLYFMPPANLTAGLHNYLIDCPGMPEIILPFFYMTLSMWADQLDLHKGQSTTYHVKLDGLNGLPASAWSSPFFPSDLVSSSEWNAKLPDSRSPGSSRYGSITLTVTNGSPDTISMQNVYTMLDAKFFAPSGSYQLNGGVGAIMDGTFSILGVARAYLQPELGLGSAASSPSSPVYSPPITNWTPIGGWDFTPPPSSNGITPPTNCSTSSAAPPYCMGPADTALYDQATGNEHSTTVENPPAKDSLVEPRKREKDAKKKAEDAKTNAEEKERAEAAAWDNGIDHVSESAAAEYKKRLERLKKAENEHKRATDKNAENPTYENSNAEFEAKKELDLAMRFMERYRRELLHYKFTKADREAWEAAHSAAEAAEREAAKARQEYDDARRNLEISERVPRDLAPQQPQIKP
jgi:hypothetical protein